MTRALKLVRNGDFSKSRAAKMWDVPRIGLFDKLYGRVREEHTKPGQRTTLIKAEEDVLVNYISLMAEEGYPVKKKETSSEVKQLLDKDGRPTPLEINFPRNDWYRGFLNRHPDMTMGKSQALDTERAIISEDMINGCFKGTFDYMKKCSEIHVACSMQMSLGFLCV